MSRNLVIDTLKGIAIWLMVFAHSNLNNQTLQIFINSFHMPLFFIVSGYFYKERKLSEHCRRDLSSLGKPYLFGSLFALLYCWVSPYIHPELYPATDSFLKIYQHAILGFFLMDDCVTSYSFLPNGPLWFLPALFFARLFFYLFVRQTSILNSVVYIFSSLLLYFICNKFNLFSLDSAFMCAPFLLMGYLAKQYSLLPFMQKNKKYALLIIGLFLLLVPFNGMTSADGDLYGKYLGLYYVNALLGFLVLYFIIDFLKLYNSRILSFWGKNTIVILIFHSFILIVIKTIYSFLGQSVSELSTLESLLFSFMTMLGCIPIIMTINNRYPFFIGK